jgi:hypothetical protein
MTDAAAARRAFVAGQVASLGPLDYVVVGVPEPPFDAVQIRKEEDGTFVLVLNPRDPSTPYTPEQVAKLAEVGFPPATPLADAEAALALAERLLSEVFAIADTTPVDVRHGSDRAVRDAARKVDEMRARIEPVLSSIMGGTAPPQDGDDDYILDLGHVRVFVAPRAMPGSPPIIRVFAITNAGLTLTPELGLFLARLNFTLMFGRFSLDADHQAVWFDETLLGDHVTDEELRFTVEMVAATANEWDQKIAATFGGRIRDPEQAGAPSTAVASSAKPGQGGYL